LVPYFKIGGQNPEKRKIEGVKFPVLK